MRAGVKQWGWGLLRAELKLMEARWELGAEEAEERKARAAADRMAVEEEAPPPPTPPVWLGATCCGAPPSPCSLTGVVVPDTSSKVSSSQEWSLSCSSTTRDAPPALLPAEGTVGPGVGRARLLPAEMKGGEGGGREANQSRVGIGKRVGRMDVRKGKGGYTYPSGGVRPRKRKGYLN